METQIIRKITFPQLEKMFLSKDSSDVNIRLLKNTSKGFSEESYDPAKKYQYEISIRHNENEDADQLFDQLFAELFGITEVVFRKYNHSKFIDAMDAQRSFLRSL